MKNQDILVYNFSPTDTFSVQNIGKFRDFSEEIKDDAAAGSRSLGECYLNG